MSTIKDRNSKDLTETEEIKKLQEYTEELYKKGLNDSDNHGGVVTHLQPDILECEVKWTLGSTTTRTSLVAQTVKHLSTMRETQVQSLGWEDHLEKEMAIHSSTIAWKIPWTEEPGRLQPTGSQKVGHH